jgi:hypothetical protein
LSQALLTAILLIALAACGKFAPVYPPESFAPASVRELGVRADQAGVHFNWEAPDQSQRGKDLKSIEGYYVLRKQLLGDADLLDTEVEFEVIATIDDRHLLERDALRKTAREEGRISRTLDVDPALKKFSYSDSTVKPGSTYAYRIVPFNQGGVRGRVGQTVRVLFRGDSSELSGIKGADFDDLEFE